MNTQKIIEVENVLLHTLMVKRNVGRGTPTNNFLASNKKISSVQKIGR